MIHQLFEDIASEIQSIYARLEKINPNSAEAFPAWLTFVGAYAKANQAESFQTKRELLENTQAHFLDLSISNLKFFGITNEILEPLGKRINLALEGLNEELDATQASAAYKC